MSVAGNDDFAFTITADAPEATGALGRALGRCATPNVVIGLTGTLGAGKTAFVRAVAEGLETPDPRAIASPTFVLVHEYEGRLPIFHFDVYRLADPAAFLQLGPEEYFGAGGVTLVEWADRVADLLPPRRLDVVIEILGEQQRSFTARAPTGPLAELARRWRAAFERETRL